MIEINQLGKFYSFKGKEFQVLENINLHIEQGKIFGVIGESGAGKSTLLRCINFLERPSTGSVLIDGVNLATLSDQALRQERQTIGMIFQHFNLLESRTVFENIALPLELLHQSRSMIQQKVLPLLNLVGLMEHKNHYPNQLSGGQKQRVAIARSLVTNPRILLCDEATSSLDPKSTLSILNLLKEINKKFNLTILLITHEMDVIKHICDQAAVLDKGQLIECGSVIELFSQPKTLITKQLVQHFLHLELPKKIRHKLQAHENHQTNPVIRFTFLGEDSGEALISLLVQRFHITVNILQANIENIQDITMGFTVCQLSGESARIQDAIAYVQTTKVMIEVLGYVHD